MAASIVGYTQITTTTNVTETNIDVPSGIQAGDVIFVFSVRPGSAASLALTGASGYVAAPEVSGSGFRGHVWYKPNAQPSDGGTTLTITNPASMRNTSAIVVVRGVKSTNPIATGDPLSTPATVGASKVAPAGTAGVDVAALYVIMAAGPHNAVTGYTSTEGVEIFESFRATSAADYTGIAAYFRSAASRSYGGGTLTQVATESTANNTVAWSFPLELAPETVVTTYVPTATVSLGTWTNEGGAATAHAALADLSDATYIQSPTGPSGAAATFSLPAVGTGAITVAVRADVLNTATPINLLVEILENSTVRAARTFTPTATPQEFSFTTTTSETAAITSRANGVLRVRVTATEV